MAKNIIAYISEFEEDMQEIKSHLNEYDLVKINSKSKSIDTSTKGIFINEYVSGGHSIPLVSADLALKYSQKYPNKPVVLVLSDENYFKNQYPRIYSDLKTKENLIVSDMDNLEETVKQFKKYEPTNKLSNTSKKYAKRMPDILCGSRNPNNANFKKY